MENLELNAARLEAAARSNEQNILNSVSGSGIFALCYAYKSRIKPEAKLIEKVHRKIKQKPDYTIEKITDVVGLRLITLFRNEIPKILGEILLLIKHQNNCHPNPFRPNCLEEVNIFTNGSPIDPFVSDLQAVLTAHGVASHVTPSKEGYSSVHIVTRIVECVNLKRAGCEIQHPMPVEIQIRSVFEDAWGEIDHRFGYVLRSGKGKENLIYNSSLVQPHLKVLKQFTDACALYADTIYTSAHAPVTVTDTSGKILSVPSDDEVLLRFSALGIPESFSQRYIEGRSLRDHALELVPSNRPAGQSACLKAAAFFLSLHQQAKTELSDTKGLSLYLFYAQMNEALCLLSTDSPQHVKSAELMYLKLREEYPGFLLVQFRLAQAQARLGNSDDAINLFIDTKKAIDDAASRYGEQDLWPDELPRTDFTHMNRLLPKLMGYQYWKKSQDVSTKEEKLSLLLKAHEVTAASVDERPQDPHIYNNLAYYAMEYLTNSEGEPTAVTKRLATSLHMNLAKLEERLKAAADEVDVSTLDTMMQAYNLLGSINLAQKIASKIVDRVTMSSEGDAEETLLILKGALQIQALEAVSRPLDRANHA